MSCAAWVTDSARAASRTLHRVARETSLSGYASSETSPSGSPNSNVFSVIDTIV